MGNVTHEIDDTYSLSVYQCEETGRKECVPVINGGGLVGEPIYFHHFEELIELFDSARNHDFKVWQNQFEFTWDDYDNDND